RASNPARGAITYLMVSAFGVAHKLGGRRSHGYHGVAANAAFAGDRRSMPNVRCRAEDLRTIPDTVSVSRPTGAQPAVCLRGAGLSRTL
ncbi:MAG: hypothetical protein AB1762_18260, partial [Gemmatimonadota bacterium]